MASIFDADEDSVDGGGAIMVESGSNYFVSVDDSVCDGGRLAAEYSLSRAGSVHRILRNSKQPLPPGEFVCVCGGGRGGERVCVVACLFFKR